MHGNSPSWACLVVVGELAERGYIVSQPLVEGAYHLIADDGHNAYRLKVKAVRMSGVQADMAYETGYDYLVAVHLGERVCWVIPPSVLNSHAGEMVLNGVFAQYRNNWDLLK